MLKIIAPKSLKNIFASKSCYYMSKRKGLEQNIKKNEINNEITHSNIKQYDQQAVNTIYQMKFMNLQFFPVSLLLAPTLLCFQATYDPLFLMGQIMAQNYASIALLMNLNFYGNKKSIIMIMTAIALLKTLPSYYSLASPLGMALLTIISPFKFLNQRQKYTQLQLGRYKSMSNIKIGYFFLFTLLAIIKAFHYSSIYEMEAKLNKFNQQNKIQMIR